MTRKLSSWLAVALAGGGLVAGCGSSSKSTSTAKTAAAPTTSSSSASTSSSSPGTTTSTATTAPAPSPQVVHKNATACVKAIEARTTLSASARVNLEGICERAASPDQSTRRKAAHEACLEILNAIHVPAGAARERALAICRAP
jgi:ABC-type transport system substrate-binding protein